MLNEFEEYHVYETDLEQAQEPLKSSIQPPIDEDCKRMRK